MSDKKRWLSVIGRFFIDLFTKNIPLKIIALLFAFLLWGYVLTIENPIYPKIVRNVEITMIGEESLGERGLMLVSRDLGTADVTVQCAIGKHSELDANRISCVVDLSNRRLNLTEDEDSKTIALTVQTTLESGYGTITSVSNGTVNVEVARISTRSSLPVAVEYTGALPSGFQVSVRDRLTISVSGMKSLVEKISRGVVTIDLEQFPIADPETLAGEYSGVYPIRFFDSSNVALEDIYNDNGETYTIEVPITIRAYREVPIVPDIRVPEGFEADQTLSRSTVTLFGDRAVLMATQQISTEPISAVEGMEAESIEAALALPEGVTLAAGDTGKVTVALTVEEIVDEMDVTVPITVEHLGDELLRGEDFPIEAVVTVRGTLRELDAFTPAYVKLTMDLKGLAAGTHTVALVTEVDSRAGNVSVELSEPTVTVTLHEVPKPEPIAADEEE